MSVPAKPFSFGDWKRTQAEKKKLEAAESRRKLTVSPINGGEKAAAAAVPKPAAAGTVMVARKPKPNLLPSQQRGYVPEPSASGTVPVQRKVMKPRLIAIFVASASMGILLVGWLFNLVF